MKRFWFGLIAMLIMAAPIAAQEPTTCNGLDEAACTIWQTAVTNTREAGTVTITGFTLDGSITSAETVSETHFSGMGQAGFAVNGSIDRLHLMMSGDLGKTYEELEIRWLGEQVFASGGDTWVTPASADPALQALITGDFVAAIFRQPDMLMMQRVDDKELNGQVMMVLEGTGAFSAFLATPAAADWLELMLATLPENERQELEATANTSDLSSMIPMMATFATDDVIQTRLWIGADDQLIHHVELILNFMIEAPVGGTFGFAFTVVVDLAEHGTSMNLAAPETFTEAEFSLSDVLTTLAESGVVAAEMAVPAQIAGTLAYGDTVTGTLNQDNPQDAWTFTGQAGDVVTITLRALDITTGLDTVLHLIAPDGTEIAMNDDHESEDAALDVFDSQIAAFSLPADGEYQIITTWQAALRGAADYELMLELGE